MKTVARRLYLLLVLAGAMAVATAGVAAEPTRTHTAFLPVARSAPGQAASSPRKGVGVEVGAAVAQDIRDIGAAWWHNWYVAPGTIDVPGFVPTVGIPEYIGRPATPATGWLLTFNEPNGPRDEGGSDIAPGEAAALWPELMAAYPDHDLLAPTMRTQTAYGYLDWRQWLDRWWAALSPAGRARVAGLSLNCYGETADCQAIVTAVRQWGQERGVTGPVVLKEFFDLDLVPWLEAQNVYYAWFVARVPDGITPSSVWGRPLFDEDGLTPWGETYRMLP